MMSWLIGIILGIISISIGLFFSWIIHIIYGIALFFFIYYIVNKDVNRGGYIDMTVIFDILYWLVFMILMIIASAIALKYDIPQVSYNLSITL